MQTPSTVFPEVQEAIQISQTRNALTAAMPTPEGAFTLNVMPDGSYQIPGQDGPITIQQLDMLKVCAAHLEQKLLGGDGVRHTAVCQPTEDTVDYSAKMPPQSCATIPTVDISTSVEVHTPDDVKKKPCYGNFSDKQSNLLEQIAVLSGIKGKGDEVEEQLTLGVSEKLSFKENQHNSKDGCQQKEEFAKPEQLPDIPIFQHTDSFELEETPADELLNEDPYLSNAIKQELDKSSVWGGENGNKTVSNTVDLGDFTGYFGKESDTASFQGYREPPASVGSVVSDYQSVLSPQNTFEAIEESSVCVSQKTERRAAQKLPHRRNSKRRISGGKDLKRLMSGPKIPKSSTGKSYPPATASNGRISRLHGEYDESPLHEGWWKMLKNVESVYMSKIDLQLLKVELLRKYCQNLFAVVLYSPTNWGNNQKRKGIYRRCLIEEYGWDTDAAPFCSLNNGPKNKKKAGTDVNDAFHYPLEADQDGDAPRAKKDDLVQMGRYMMRRYENEVRPKVRLRTESNQLIRLAPEYDTPMPTKLNAVASPPPPQHQLANTVRNYIAARADTVKAESVIATESNACDFHAPVSFPTATETNSYVAMEKESNNSTLDFEVVMEILGGNILMTTDGQQDLSSLNIQPREQDSQMDTDNGMFAYKNPEIKGDVKTGEPTTPFAKVKLEHSYSIPEGENEPIHQELPGMTVTSDSAIPGAVLQLAETKANSSMIQTLNGEQYMVAKMAEAFPTEHGYLMDIIDQLNPAGM